MSVIGIDLGGTKIAAALFNQHGRILRQNTVLLEGRKSSAVGQLLRHQLAGLLEVARSRRLSVSAIGVSVPGISYSKSGRVWAPNIPGWENYPLRGDIRSVLPGNSIPVVIDNDRACSILGEKWRGAARGCHNAIFLAVGTGIGAGILVDGQVLRGAHDIAGSIGWLALDRPFRRKYLGCGCLEYHASGAGLSRVATELQHRRRQTVSSKHSGHLTAADLFAASEKGDRTARLVLTQAIEFWGMTVANLVSLFNPEKIIFGGGVFGPARRYLADIYAEARKWAQPVAITQVSLETSRLGGQAALHGAGYLGLQAGGSRGSILPPRQ